MSKSTLNPQRMSEMYKFNVVSICRHFRGQNIGVLGKYWVPRNTNLLCSISASQGNFSLIPSDFFHLLSPMIIDEITYRITFLFHDVFKFSH
ncbi:unnamed protein product [Clonostachys rhizophaga]|uniref:Uncharacterized protein n=1 Tax=Clonostachys rhizophaga TaxID=160324 RepID=A0A9N9V432_9HYPO|nr:unnamed protein product [Clonostachys rhizophaga]